MSLHFREWLVKQSENDQSIDFWRVVFHRKLRRNVISNISNIRVQGNIYTALLFFFDEFDGCNVPFLEKTLKKITNNISNIENIENEYSRLIDNIVYGYDYDYISLCLVDITRYYSIYKQING